MAQRGWGLQLAVKGTVLGPYHRQQKKGGQGGLHDVGLDASQPEKRLRPAPLASHSEQPPVSPKVARAREKGRA